MKCMCSKYRCAYHSFKKMEKIGKHFECELYYLNYAHSQDLSLMDNWICFAISNSSFDKKKFEQFVRNSIRKGLLEFKTQGKFGENLHLTFDCIMVKMETDENYPPVDICTTGDNESDLANAFWECFYALALPDHADHERIKILCVNIDKKDYKSKLQSLIWKFDQGWLPEENRYKSTKRINM